MPGTLDISGGSGRHLAIPSVRMSPESATAIVRDYFGISCRAEVLGGEADRNFRVVTADQMYFLKVSRIEAGFSSLSLQTSVLRHLERLAADLPVPRVINSSVGDDIIFVTDDDGCAASACLMTFLPGRPLANVEVGASYSQAVGTMLSSLDASLSTFEHPAMQRDLLWDVTYAFRIRPLLDYIDSPEKVSLVAATFDRLEKSVYPRLKGLRWQAIHNDFNPHNVLVSEDQSDASVIGVLDFGDLIQAPLINDLAIALAYVRFEEESAARTMALIASSYHAVNPITEAEWDVLIDLIMGRQAMVIAITEWRANLHPENRQYIRRNSDNAWTGLQMLSEMNPVKFVADLRV